MGKIEERLEHLKLDIEELGIPYPIDYREAEKIIFKKYNQSMDSILDMLEKLKQIFKN